jgi:hypothetical protein
MDRRDIFNLTITMNENRDLFHPAFGCNFIKGKSPVGDLGERKRLSLISA